MKNYCLLVMINIRKIYSEDLRQVHKAWSVNYWLSPSSSCTVSVCVFGKVSNNTRIPPCWTCVWRTLVLAKQLECGAFLYVLCIINVRLNFLVSYFVSSSFFLPVLRYFLSVHHLLWSDRLKSQAKLCWIWTK